MTSTSFEGPEKKLEIIFLSPQPEMRSNHDRRWDKVAEASGSKIISKISGTYMDAYLLSESSLFVWEDAILMITCGQTSLVNALPEILKLIDKSNVRFIFYERKNFLFPREQPSDFEQDVSRILEFFPGKSYRLGPANHDHLHVFYWASPEAVTQPDATLQILMKNLDPSVMKFFSQEHIKTAEQAGKNSGLYGLCPRNKMISDDYLFSPYGYSLNGISDKNYFTVHVTPQTICSYASFETNIIEENYSQVIRDVTSIFRPAKFSLVLTTSMEHSFVLLHSTVKNVLPGYTLTERSMYGFDSGYTVTFLNYISSRESEH
jgi:S-adenosylmethionine decarboxylase